MYMKDLSNIKIIFIDIDGTLVNSRNHVSMKTKRSIKRVVNNGVYVVITSGRNCMYCVDKSRKALASKIVISSNGAEVYDYSLGNFISNDYISHDIMKDIWQFCNDNDIGIVFNGFKGTYINKYLIGNNIYDSELVTSLKELKSLNVSQFIMVSNDADKIFEARDFVIKKGLVIGNYSNSFKNSSSYFYIDVVNSDINKGSGVSSLLNYLDIDKEDSLCFGDFVNDIDMFDSCGFGVAMGNAHEDLKKKADFVTLSNDENGIAYFLDKYL